MPSIAPQSNPGDIYRCKFWVVLFKTLVSSGPLLVIAVCGAGIAAGMRMLATNVETVSTRADLSLPKLILLFMIPIVMIIPNCLLVGVGNLYVLVLGMGNAFLSYVKVSPEEFEYCSWPRYHVRCNWEMLEWQSYSANWSVARRLVNLEKADEVEVSALTKIWREVPARLGLGTRSPVSLHEFQGYPDGELADNLRRYAPHLF
jgi:hypothetical protein